MVRRTPSKLTNEHKAFLVQRLACWDSPKEAAEALKAEHGITITPQGAEAYDPNKRAGRSLAKQWRQLYAETRERFLKNLEDIPEANKPVRIRQLAKMARSAQARGNYPLAANLLEQIAKEVGGSFTNKREVSGPDGKPVQLQDVGALTDEQINAQLAQLLKPLLPDLAGLAGGGEG